MMMDQLIVIENQNDLKRLNDNVNSRFRAFQDFRI